MSSECIVTIKNNKAYFLFNGLDNRDIVKMLEYRSWNKYIWGLGYKKVNYVFPYSIHGPKKILWTYVGFSPMFIRFLRNLGVSVHGVKVYNSKKVDFPKPKFDLYSYQRHALEEWMKYGVGTIKLPTGGGKTIIACHIIYNIGMRTIICVHTVDLMLNVWFNTLVEQFGFGIRNKIGIVGGGVSERDRENLCITRDTSIGGNLHKDIVIASMQTLTKSLDKLSNEKFGMLIVDEVHHVPASTFRKVVGSTRAPYRCGLSATLKRPDHNEKDIFAMVGNIKSNITIKSLIERGILVTPRFTSFLVKDYNVIDEINKSSLSGVKFAKHVKEKSASSDLKFYNVLKVVDDLIKRNKRFFLYTDFVNAKNVKYTRDVYYSAIKKELSGNVVAIDSSFSSVMRQDIFKLLEKNELHGVIFGKLGGEGLNLPSVDSVIIANASKSEIMFPQRVGRSLRSRDGKTCAEIYDFVIDVPLERKWERNSFYEYKEEGFKKRYVVVR